MTYTDEELIAQYKQGEQRAFGEIFARYYPDALRFFTSDPLTASYAEDYCQEIFARLARAMLVSEILNFKNLFYKALINRKRDLIRQKYRQQVKPVSLFQEFSSGQSSGSRQRFLLEIIEIRTILNPEDELLYKELEKIVRECINKIKSKNRREIIALKLEGLKEQQISEFLGLNPHTVSSNWGRAKVTLRQCILENLGT